MNQVENLQVVDEKEAARIMRRAVQTLRNDRHLRRGVPYCKVGRSIRYLVEDINAYLLKRRIDPEEN